MWSTAGAFIGISIVLVVGLIMLVDVLTWEKRSGLDED